MSDPTQQYQRPTPVEEAINRYGYDERLAWGDVEGETVWLSAAVGDRPVLTIVAGCEVHVDEDGSGTPIGGHVHDVPFEGVDLLDAAFEQYAEKYGLDEHPNSTTEVVGADERE